MEGSVGRRQGHLCRPQEPSGRLSQSHLHMASLEVVAPAGGRDPPRKIPVHICQCYHSRPVLVLVSPNVEAGHEGGASVFH